MLYINSYIMCFLKYLVYKIRRIGKLKYLKDYGVIDFIF